MEVIGVIKTAEVESLQRREEWWVVPPAVIRTGAVEDGGQSSMGSVSRSSNLVKSWKLGIAQRVR
jgi:hypothetical protein